MRNIPEQGFSKARISKQVHIDDVKALLALTVVIGLIVVFCGVLTLNFVEVV